MYKKQWVVYAKSPFGGVNNVIKYLARYSHRVAITNHRIKSVTQTHVTFVYKDYKDEARSKLMTLNGSDFLNRFCLHILPPKFRKIRHYGILANASKKKSLQLARASLKTIQFIALTKKQRRELAKQRIFSDNVNMCPCCGKGIMTAKGIWPKNKDPPNLFRAWPIHQSI